MIDEHERVIVFGILTEAYQQHSWRGNQLLRPRIPFHLGDVAAEIMYLRMEMNLINERAELIIVVPPMLDLVTRNQTILQRLDFRQFPYEFAPEAQWARAVARYNELKLLQQERVHWPRVDFFYMQHVVQSINAIRPELTQFMTGSIYEYTGYLSDGIHPTRRLARRFWVRIEAWFARDIPTRQVNRITDSRPINRTSVSRRERIANRGRTATRGSNHRQTRPTSQGHTSIPSNRGRTAIRRTEVIEAVQIPTQQGHRPPLQRRISVEVYEAIHEEPQPDQTSQQLAQLVDDVPTRSAPTLETRPLDIEMVRPTVPEDPVVVEQNQPPAPRPISRLRQRLPPGLLEPPIVRLLDHFRTTFEQRSGGSIRWTRTELRADLCQYLSENPEVEEEET